ncbi:glycoside hydrolase family 28 protein [Polluticaenibacter yanchengensis]|uniref:Glycoside hydrolase family 28 protein n=1 Tax=Polluticaenibacter yanchengensis TaxID=3014562 RepID=A0ABT4UHL5_9BACT|nr:glycoside hydrolase family 28 protein [Chitinophagaceae bacterium LY-5]
MKKIITWLGCLLLILNAKSQTNFQEIEAYRAKAPFEMPKVVVPVFKNADYNIADFGGKNDGITLNTEAINKAILICSNSGGGRVIIPKGTWLTGPITLQSNVNLHLEKGALIQFTKDHTQYPFIRQSSKSNTYVVASPIHGYDLKNVALTGQGIFDGAGESWRPVKKSKQTDAQWKALLASGGVLSKDQKIWWPSQEAMDGDDYLKTLKAKGEKPDDKNQVPARTFLRPYMFYLSNCENILVEDVTISNAPKFVFYPNRCNNLTISGAKIINDWWAQNGDGIDISQCKNVVIYNSFVSCGDDAICMKSSSNNGDAVNTFNLENVLIAKNRVEHGHGGFVIGSNTDGGMRNIYVTDCEFDGTDVGIRIKSNAGRGGDIQKIYIDNIKMKNIVEEAISFDTYYADVPAGKTRADDATTKRNNLIPEFHDFHISNVTVENAGFAFFMRGLETQKIYDIHLNNVHINAKNGGEISDAEKIFFTNSSIKITNALPVLNIKNASNIDFANFEFGSKNSQYLKLGDNVSAITIKTGNADAVKNVEYNGNATKSAITVLP